MKIAKKIAHLLIFLNIFFLQSLQGMEAPKKTPTKTKFIILHELTLAGLPPELKLGMILNELNNASNLKEAIDLMITFSRINQEFKGLITLSPEIVKSLIKNHKILENISKIRIAPQILIDAFKNYLTTHEKLKNHFLNIFKELFKLEEKEETLSSDDLDLIIKFLEPELIRTFLKSPKSLEGVFIGAFLKEAEKLVAKLKQNINAYLNTIKFLARINELNDEQKIYLGKILLIIAKAKTKVQASELLDFSKLLSNIVPIEYIKESFLYALKYNNLALANILEDKVDLQAIYNTTSITIKRLIENYVQKRIDEQPTEEMI